MQTVFIYSIVEDTDETDITSIRIYGLNEANETICLHIDDFNPYVYIELPLQVEWSAGTAQLLSDYIDDISGKNCPIKKTLVFRKKLYGANLNKEGDYIKFPYLLCTFSNREDIRKLNYKLKKPLSVYGLGVIQLKMHEQDASSTLQLTCVRDIPTAGWVSFKGTPLKESDLLTYCKEEYSVKWKSLTKVETDIIPKPKIMAFDIEVNSSNIISMPNVANPEDKIFQISCVFGRPGEKEYDHYLLTLFEPDPDIVGHHVTIIMYNTEADLLFGFAELINSENPNLIAGYNIMGFDIPYMIKRSKHPCMVYSIFTKHGFHKYKPGKEKLIKWSSSAYGTQEFEFIDVEGRVYVDLLPLVKRDFKMDNYKLKTVTEYFLGETKDPLSAKGIFKCYRLGLQGVMHPELHSLGKRAMGIVGRYCVVDSELILNLMEKLQTWIGLCEMAKTTCVSIFTLYTQGQQIKVYSQIYKYCMYNGIVVEKDVLVSDENERYSGAYIFEPEPGIYTNVVPFDFSSLYPTTIIAYNIDHHSWVTDPSIPDSKCHIMDFEEHVSCEHDPKMIRKEELTKIIDSLTQKLKDLRLKRDSTKEKEPIIEQINKVTAEIKPYTKERSEIMKSKSKFPICAKRYFRFLKEPKGVFPTVLQNLLDARKKTRLVMRSLKELIAKEENEIKKKEMTTLLDVLDKRQLSYKISCNSMYGCMGVRRGLIPFMPGAMCVTYMGRKNIDRVSKLIPSDFKGKLVYGDSVTGYTPIYIKCGNVFSICSIEDLADKYGYGEWESFDDIEREGKEYCELTNVLTWSDKGWIPVKRIIRHALPSSKKVMRVMTSSSLIDVTDDHSLLTAEKRKIKPEFTLTKNLLCSNFEYIESDQEEISDQEAMLWGYFFANHLSSIDTNIVFHFTTKKRCSEYANFCKDIYCDYNWIVEENFTGYLLKIDNPDKLFLQAQKKNLYYNECKIIPKQIIHGSLNLKHYFWRGVVHAVGKEKEEFSMVRILIRHFKNDEKSIHMFMASLIWLGYQLGYQYFFSETDTPHLTNSIVCVFSKQKTEQPFSINMVKACIKIPFEKSGYVYDLTTENHHFSAGIGNLVIHNTDSSYQMFPHLTQNEEIWNYAEHVANEISKHFPDPIKLEFEEVIYSTFFILTKKRYMYRASYKEGIVQNKIGKKGVLLARRDNSKFIRDTYEGVVMKMFEEENKDNLVYYLISRLVTMFSNSCDLKDFVITKSVRECDMVEECTDEKGKSKLKYGSYVVPRLPEDEVEREKQLALKGADSESEYYSRCLPAHIQLAIKIRERGNRVDVGSRLEYVITDTGDLKAKLYDKLESYEYAKEFKDIIKIDYLYYTNLLINPIDQLFEVVYKEKDFMKKQYIYFENKYKLLKDIKRMFQPVLLV